MLMVPAFGTTLSVVAMSVFAQSPIKTSPYNGVTSTLLASFSSQTPKTTPSTELFEAASGEIKPRVHLVKAGAGGFHFEPAELANVSVGDIVTFEFYPPDHSVARADYGSACVPYEYTGKDRTGFWSGTQWVKTPSEITHWNLTVNGTEPIFYYCAAPGSCKEKQMVGVINPNNTQKLHEQVLAAANADFQIAPGEPIPKEASQTTDFMSSVSFQPSIVASSQEPSRLSTPAIVGIVIGGVVFTTILGGILFLLARRSRMKAQIVCPPSTELPKAHDRKDDQFSPVSPLSGVAPYEGYFSLGPQLDSRQLAQDRRPADPVELDTRKY